MKNVSNKGVVKEIRRRTRKKYSSEEKIWIVLDGLRDQENLSAICRREGIPNNLYYRWSKDFLESGKKRLMGNAVLLQFAHHLFNPLRIPDLPPKTNPCCMLGFGSKTW
jgi:transposase